MWEFSDSSKSDENVILDLYILLKIALKMQEMPFQRPKIQTFSGEHRIEEGRGRGTS